MTHWNRIVLICSALLASIVVSVSAEESAPANPVTPAAAAKHPLKRILIAESIEAAQILSVVPTSGFVVLSPALSKLDLAELTKRLAAGENQVIEEKLLTSVSQVIENFARQQNFPTATTILPTQNISEGAVRFVLILKPPALKQILIGESVEAAQKLTPVPDGGFVVLSPALSFLKSGELTKRLEPGKNQALQEKLLAAIAQVIEVFVRQSDFPVATAVVPPQNPSDGVVRVAVQFGKVRNIKVAGNRWFSESLLREKLRVEQGGTLRLSELDRAISWTNNNPFRRVNVQLDPIAATGEVDLIVAVQEALPLRLTASYDNSGNDVVGKNHYVAAVSYANLWGLDHQVSYQFITTDLGPRVYQGHGFDYRVPLPWRDTIQFSASYLHVRSELIKDFFNQDGENMTAELRYTHPLRVGETPAEAYAGLNFKESNNDLAFGGVDVLTTKTDIFQFIAGASTLLRDKHGAWAMGASLSASPGRVNSRNSGTAFNDTRFGAKPYYAYGSFTLQRLQNLKHGWDFTTRAVLQVADGNLLSSEQLYIGGSSSVRGFRENVFGGDEGILFTNELMTPAWKKSLKFLPKNHNALDTRLLAFYDAGDVRLKHRNSLDPIYSTLASTGVGLRMNVATNFNLSADYGWQITHLPYAMDEHSRGHIKATLAY